MKSADRQQRKIGMPVCVRPTHWRETCSVGFPPQARTPGQEEDLRRAHPPKLSRGAPTTTHTNLKRVAGQSGCQSGMHCRAGRGRDAPATNPDRRANLPEGSLPFGWPSPGCTTEVWSRQNSQTTATRNEPLPRTTGRTGLQPKRCWRYRQSLRSQRRSARNSRTDATGDSLRGIGSLSDNHCQVGISEPFDQ